MILFTPLQVRWWRRNASVSAQHLEEGLASKGSVFKFQGWSPALTDTGSLGIVQNDDHEFCGVIGLMNDPAIGKSSLMIQLFCSKVCASSSSQLGQLPELQLVSMVLPLNRKVQGGTRFVFQHPFLYVAVDQCILGVRLDLDRERVENASAELLFCEALLAPAAMSQVNALAYCPRQHLVACGWSDSSIFLLSSRTAAVEARYVPLVYDTQLTQEDRLRFSSFPGRLLMLTPQYLLIWSFNEDRNIDAAFPSSCSTVETPPLRLVRKCSLTAFSRYRSPSSFVSVLPTAVAISTNDGEIFILDFASASAALTGHQRLEKRRMKSPFPSNLSSTTKPSPPVKETKLILLSPIQPKARQTWVPQVTLPTTPAEVRKCLIVSLLACAAVAFFSIVLLLRFVIS